LAEIVGYGTAFAPPPRSAALTHASEDAVAEAIAGALDDARIDRRDVDVVVSGVSGASPFDGAELSAIDRAVGNETCVVAPKVAVGETFGAGGAIAMLTAISALQGDLRSYEVRGSLRGSVRTALVTSVGYYGNASALVMRATSR
jgi:3-oxoacyl-(acyl-carrier-protein) synthase